MLFLIIRMKFEKVNFLNLTEFILVFKIKYTSILQKISIVNDLIALLQR